MCHAREPGFGGAVDVPGILEFVDSGRNLILAASSQISDMLRSLAAEVGVDVDEKGTAVYDHFQHATSGKTADHTLVIARDVVDSKGIFDSAVKVRTRGRGLPYTQAQAAAGVMLLACGTRAVAAAPARRVCRYRPAYWRVVAVPAKQSSALRLTASLSAGTCALPWSGGYRAG